MGVVTNNDFPLLTNTTDPHLPFCYNLHTLPIPSIQNTVLNALNAFICALSFFFIMWKSGNNTRKAIAGIDSGKAIKISWYTYILDAALLWAMMWGMYSIFHVSYSGVVASQRDWVWSRASAGLTSGYSAALQCFVLILLTINSIGQDTFRKAVIFAFGVFCLNFIGELLSGYFVEKIERGPHGCSLNYQSKGNCERQGCFWTKILLVNDLHQCVSESLCEDPCLKERGVALGQPGCKLNVCSSQPHGMREFSREMLRFSYMKSFAGVVAIIIIAAYVKDRNHRGR
jgi:hypothetical protein